ncbi:nitroreductase [Caulobacter mirabilis]|uniref:Nitroreductase family protein n=1 Tax=Caulobacter mirabilis TaxID=69666 RepID=A0A2D2AT91_9CAUL|nr:nitroreductase [Caulobacter mirabilis]ATQ41228.1 nitroreductase family protein [Caulobacter mirabilis]
MNVTEAVQRRVSVRAFKPDPVPGALVREILELAQRAPSGGNLQPWRVHALARGPLEELKAKVAANLAGEEPEYDVYPPELWDPFRTRRFQCGEDLYATIGIPREDKPARLRQLFKNTQFFGAPVGLFFSLDRNLGKPQWADVGMYMQTVMLLAVERGLATCAQEFWARYPKTVGDFIGLPEDHMLFSGMAMGWADEAAPINSLRTRRDPFEVWAEMQGFD